MFLNIIRLFNIFCWYCVEARFISLRHVFESYLFRRVVITRWISSRNSQFIFFKFIWYIASFFQYFMSFCANITTNLRYYYELQKSIRISFLFVRFISSLDRYNMLSNLGGAKTSINYIIQIRLFFYDIYTPKDAEFF